VSETVRPTSAVDGGNVESPPQAAEAVLWQDALLEPEVDIQVSASALRNTLMEV
jgi:hypothetical protein